MKNHGAVIFLGVSLRLYRYGLGGAKLYGVNQQQSGESDAICHTYVSCHSIMENFSDGILSLGCIHSGLIFVFSRFRCRVMQYSNGLMYLCDGSDKINKTPRITQSFLNLNSGERFRNCPVFRRGRKIISREGSLQ